MSRSNVTAREHPALTRRAITPYVIRPHDSDASASIWRGYHRHRSLPAATAAEGLSDISALLQRAKMHNADPLGCLTQTLERFASGWPELRNRRAHAVLGWTAPNGIAMNADRQCHTRVCHGFRHRCGQGHVPNRTVAGADC